MFGPVEKTLMALTTRHCMNESFGNAKHHLKMMASAAGTKLDKYVLCSFGLKRIFSLICGGEGHLIFPFFSWLCLSDEGRPLVM